MKKYISAVLLVLLSTATFAAAQMTASVYADIPFQFFVGNKAFQAGSYQFTANSNLDEMTVASTKGKDTILAPVITRLSPRSESEAAVVFDVAGGNHYLAEIYMPGIDGFQVQGAAVKHTHVSVKGRK